MIKRNKVLEHKVVQKIYGKYERKLYLYGQKNENPI